MRFPSIPKFKLNSAKEEPSPLPPLFLRVFPLSLSLPLPSPSSSWTTTVTKPYRSGSTDTLVSHIFSVIVSVASVIFTTRLLSWCAHWSQKNNVLSILQRSLIWFVPSRFLEGKRRPDKEIRDEVAWGNLPSELWGEIGQRLSSRLDILRFRTVCDQWRSSLPCPTRFPLQVPPPPSCDPKFRNMPYFITEVNIYSSGDGGWSSVGFEEGGQAGKFRAQYVIPSNIKFEFSMASLMEYPKHPISRLQFVSKAYHLRSAVPRFDSHRKRIEGQWKFRSNKFAKKMVLISSNADGVNPSYARASDLSVVAHLSWGSMKGRLALLRLGGSPKNRDWDTGFCSQVFQDIATYKGQLCTLDPSGRVFILDYHSLQMTRVAPPSSLVRELRLKYLFEGFGGLYLAYKKKTSDRLKVYMLCLQRQKWIKADDDDKRKLALLAFHI